MPYSFILFFFIGCGCGRAISIDNQYDQDYLNQFLPLQCFTNYTLTNNSDNDSSISSYNTCNNNAVADISQYYRGPYSYAATDFTSYNCGTKKCPFGDNPLLDIGFNEIQIITCNANSGSFKLTFRENTTLSMNYNDSIHVLKERLEQIFTIRKVHVSILNSQLSTSICTPTKNQEIHIEFLTEFGQIPLIKFNNMNLVYTSFHISQLQKCTKESLECSRAGICNEETGICQCVFPYGSSDGLSSKLEGSTGDCTYFYSFF